MIQQKRFPGIKVVSPETAKELKELGWCWETPWILKVKSEEALIPVKPIDCNVGDAYRYLPTISQVIDWLEKWGINFSWEYESYNGVGFYYNPKLHDDTETVEHLCPEPDGGWYNIESLLEDIIPEAIEYLKKAIKWKYITGEGKEIWVKKGKYQWMLTKGYIKDVKFYEFFKSEPI